MMVNDKGGVNPLVLKLGVALAISFATFVYSQLRSRKASPDPSRSADDKESNSSSVPMSPTSGDACSISNESMESHLKDTMSDPPTEVASSKKDSGDEDGFLLPELNDIVLEELEAHSNNYNVSPSNDVDRYMTVKISVDREKEEEIHNLKSMVHDLRERERNLEMQLLEYYGLKEQEATIRELQNRLKINSMEAKVLTLKIESLQADKKRLEDQVAERSKVVEELESAKQMISMLKKKQRLEKEHTKEQLSLLRQKVADLQGQEQNASQRDLNTEKTLLRIKELEAESTELRLANSRLQYENAELQRRFGSTQIHSTSTMETPEVEALKESNHRLREENDDLKSKIEQIQETRCADVEELVYLRWVNACLRYELRHHTAPPGKTVARDLCKNLSPRSEEKVKQLILEYANSEGIGYESLLDFDSECWSSSQDSNHTESVELNDSSVDTTTHAKKTHSSSKSKFFSKLRKLVNGKDSSAEDGSPLSYATTGRRDSISSFDDTRTYSSSTVAGSESRLEEYNNKIASHAHSILRTSASLDNQRPRALSLDGLHEIKGRRRNSDMVSSYSYKRVGRSASSLGRDGRSEQDGDSEKLELMKLAQALNVSIASPTLHGSPDSENLELTRMTEVLDRSKVSARQGGRSVYSSF